MPTSFTSDSITYYRNHRPIATVKYGVEIDREGDAAFVYVGGIYAATIHRVGTPGKSRRWASGALHYDSLQAAARDGARRRAGMNRELLEWMLGDRR